MGPTNSLLVASECKVSVYAPAGPLNSGSGTFPTSPAGDGTVTGEVLM